LSLDRGMTPLPRRTPSLSASLAGPGYRSSSAYSSAAVSESWAGRRIQFRNALAQPEPAPVCGRRWLRPCARARLERLLRLLERRRHAERERVAPRRAAPVSRAAYGGRLAGYAGLGELRALHLGRRRPQSRERSPSIGRSCRTGRRNRPRPRPAVASCRSCRRCAVCSSRGSYERRGSGRATS
jgi:hypothetical protein